MPFLGLPAILDKSFIAIVRDEFACTKLTRRDHLSRRRGLLSPRPLCASLWAELAADRKITRGAYPVLIAPAYFWLPRLP